MSKIFKVLIPLIIGIFFIYLSFETTTEQDRENILMSIKNADYRYILLSPLFGFLSHLSRAYRWKFLLSPLGYNPSFINSTLSVFIAYISNLGIPRSGEIIRATVMNSYEKIPFEKGFGTIVAERIIDLILLICFLFIALSYQNQHKVELQPKPYQRRILYKKHHHNNNCTLRLPIKPKPHHKNWSHTNNR